MRRDVTAALQRRVEELERELAMRDAVQEAPAPQSPSKAVQQLRKSLERPADRPRRAPPPPTMARRATRRRGSNAWRAAILRGDGPVPSPRSRPRCAPRSAAPGERSARGAATARGRAGGSCPDGAAPSLGSAGSRPLADGPLRRQRRDVREGPTHVHRRRRPGATIERDQALLVRTAHLADASGWVFAAPSTTARAEAEAATCPSRTSAARCRRIYFKARNEERGVGEAGVA